MFRRTDPQLSLMESSFLVGPKKQERLKRSWAEVVRTKVLPLIDEEAFRECFHEDNGRPNKSIRLLVGLHILKEADDLTDEQVLDALEFNIQWQHALGVEPATAHVCEKTLHNFRHKLLENERAQGVFNQVTGAMMKMDGLSAVRQRLDSTHVISNIAVLTRLGVLTETVTNFLRELRKEGPEKLAKLDADYAKRYLDREGYFADAKREQAQRRLPVVAQDLYALVRAFEADATVKQWASYALLVRVLAEQCEVVAAQGEPDAVVVKDPKTISATSLQSPHDPDATYGHKGKGYEAQIAETCVPQNAYQVVTAVAVHGAHESDQNATVPMVEQLAERGLTPEVLLADTGYGSGENIVQCAQVGVELLARVQDPGAPPRADRWEEPVGAAGNTTGSPSQEPATQEPTGAAQPVAAASPADAPGADLCEEPVVAQVPPADRLPIDDPAPAVPEGRVGAQESAAPFGLGSFAFSATFDQVLRCPAGHAPAHPSATDLASSATFSGSECAGCPLAGRCPTRPRAHTEDRVLRWRASTAATASRQQEQQKPAFKNDYKLRSGIESTNAELKGRHGAGDLRVRGEARVELALFLKALALNVKRAVQFHTDALRDTLNAAAAASMTLG
jgi:hypothetical protein